MSKQVTEVFISMGLFLWGIIKRWYLLLPTIMLDPFDIVGRVFNVTYNPPQWLVWTLFWGGLFLAAWLTYNEIRQQNKVANAKIVTHEWEYERKRRIELIEKETYPKVLPKLLEKMKTCLATIEKGEELTDKTAEELSNSLKGITPKNFYIAATQSKYDDSITTLATFYRHMQFAMNGIKLNEDNNTDWIKLEKTLTDVKKDIPDLILKDGITAYYHALKGVNYLNLFYYHMNKTQASDMVQKTMSFYTYPEDLLDYCLARIVKRIQSLLCGEEIIWQNKELRKR